MPCPNPGNVSGCAPGFAVENRGRRHAAAGEAGRWPLRAARWVALWVASLLVIGVGSGAYLQAQVKLPTTPPPSPSVPPSASPAPSPSPLTQIWDGVFVKDKKGEYVAFANISLEQLMHMMRMMQGLEAPQPPQAMIQRVEVTGEVVGNVAELEAHLELQVDQETATPFTLPRVILRDSRYEGPGTFTLERRGQGELVGWLTGKPGDSHQLHLTFAASVDVRGNARRLDLSLPRAAVSTMTLRVPGSQIDVQNSSNVGILTTSAEGELTKLNLQGFHDPFWIQWSERPQEPQEESVETAALVSVAEIRAEVEGPGKVSCDATFNVSSPRPITTLDVLLPPHAELRSVTELPDDAVVSELGYGTSPTTSTSLGLRIQLARPLDQLKFIVHTHTDRAPQADVAEGGIDVAAFRIPQAVRQTGTLQVLWRTPWDVRLKSSGPLRRISAVRPNPAADTNYDAEATFEFFQQPCELRLTVDERPTRLLVSPSYSYQIDADGVTLVAKLGYRLRGMPPEELEIDMGAWQVSSLEPRQQIEQATAPWDQQDGILRVPLWPMGTAAATEFQLEIRAHRPLDLSRGPQLVLDLPRPRAESLSGATFEIYTQENVRFSLDPDIAKSPLPEAASQLDSQVAGFRLEGKYRLPTASQPRSLACEVDVLEKIITAEVASHATLTADSVDIRQEFRYRVQHALTRSLEWMVPKELLGLPGEITVEGQTVGNVPWSETERFPEVTNDPQRVVVNFYLPQDRTGRFPVSIHYRVPLQGPAGTQLRQRIPLIMPRVDHWEANTLSVQGGTFWHLQTPTPATGFKLASRSDVDPNLSLPSLDFRADREWSYLDLDLEPVAERDHQLVRMERFWLQTWLSPRDRRDRAVFRFTTQAPSVTLFVPQDANDMQLILDGEALNWDAPPVTDQGGYVVPLRNTTSRTRTHVLELAYHLPRRSWGQGTIVQVPSLEHVASVGRTDWSLVLPPQEYLIAGTGALTAEEQWNWNGLFWSRQPTWTQSELEQALEATKQTPPSVTAQEYAFSTINAMEPMTIRTVPRLVIAMIASFVTFSLGMSLVYFSALRRPWLFLLTGSLLIPLIALSPAHALFLGQLAGPGALVSLLGMALHRIAGNVSSRSRVSPALRGGHGSSRVANPVASTAPVAPPTSAGSSIPSIAP